MNKADFYRVFLGRIIKRLPLGIVAAGVFLLFWYKADGYNLWGHFVNLWWVPLGWLAEVGFDPGSLKSASFYYAVEIFGQRQEIAYKVNQLNSNLVVLVTLLATIPHKDFKSFATLAGWSFVFMIFYQMFSTWIQCYSYAIGPDMANRLGVFWEDSLWYTIIRNVGGFDKFILRYYGAFPILGLALMARYFLSRRGKQASKANSQN